MSAVEPPIPASEPPQEEAPRRPDGKFGPGNDFGKSTRFGPGGDPANGGGIKRALTVRQLEEKARDRCESVFLVWETILLDAKKADRDRIRAGELIAAYGMGRPRQAITVSGEEGKPPVMVDSITQMLERMIAGAPAPAASPSPADARPEAITVEARLLEAPATPSPGDGGAAQAELEAAAAVGDGRAA